MYSRIRLRLADVHPLTVPRRPPPRPEGLPTRRGDSNAMPLPGYMLILPRRSLVVLRRPGGCLFSGLTTPWGAGTICLFMDWCFQFMSPVSPPPPRSFRYVGRGHFTMGQGSHSLGSYPDGLAMSTTTWRNMRTYTKQGAGPGGGKPLRSGPAR